MGGTDPPRVVSDAGPIIHLDELGCLDLLADLGSVLIPQDVWLEIARYRPNLEPAGIVGANILDVRATPTARLIALSDSLGLDAGERAALILMESTGSRLFLSDDAAARLAAESLGYVVHGTLGIVIRAIRRGMRTRQQVLAILRNLPRTSTLHLSNTLLMSVIASVERESAD